MANQKFFPMLVQSDTNYPRPQLRRSEWHCLNGAWRFTFNCEEGFVKPNEISSWEHTIQVPYCPESPASGVHDPSFHRHCWYEREFNFKPKENMRSLLHFGAVDYSCRVWVNNRLVGVHEGGFSAFYFDITPFLKLGEDVQKVTVWVHDDPHDLAMPRGKQDWQLEPHSIWYPRTTGIWQTVWLEEVPTTFLDRIDWTPHVERWEIGCEVFLGGHKRLDNLEVKVKLMCRGQVLADDSYHIIKGEAHRRIALADPGIDDFRNELLWSPERPTLIDAEIQLLHEGKIIDEVRSYTALRSVSVRKDKFTLNGRPYYLRLALDQGYWPESLMTAPDMDAHRRDVELTKKMGFNGVRKHQKIEDPNYLYWADVLGLLVWVEMPSAYRFTHAGVERIMREWIEIIDQTKNHPSVSVWVPFNESWGVPDLLEKKAHQHCVQALYHLTHTLDPTRPVIGNDGWESTATDIIGIHDYDNNPQRLRRRYSSRLQPGDLLALRQPAGRPLKVEGYPHAGQPIMLTEFGGIACGNSEAGSDNTWGYAVGRSIREYQEKLVALLAVVNKIEVFAGFCYTQLTDTFQEANGLLYADRTPKIPLEIIAAAIKGKGSEREEGVAETVLARQSPAELPT